MFFINLNIYIVSLEKLLTVLGADGEDDGSSYWPSSVQMARMKAVTITDINRTSRRDWWILLLRLLELQKLGENRTMPLHLAFETCSARGGHAYTDGGLYTATRWHFIADTCTFWLIMTTSSLDHSGELSQAPYCIAKAFRHCANIH